MAAHAAIRGAGRVCECVCSNAVFLKEFLIEVRGQMVHIHYSMMG